MTRSAVIVATDQSARLHSSRPAPLHVLCGQPVALYALAALDGVRPGRIVLVAGADGEQVAKKLSERAADARLSFIDQAIPRGSARAVGVALALLDDPLDEGDVVVVPGDAPLLRSETVAALVAAHDESGAAATVLTVEPAQPRPDKVVVRRADGRVEGIGREDGLAIGPSGNEVAAGVYCFRRSLLSPALRRVRPDIVTGEERLEDVVAVLAGTGHAVETVSIDDPSEVATVDDRAQMAEAEREIRRRVNRQWLEAGVSMVDPDRTYLDTSVALAHDVTLFPGVLLQGDTVVGPGAEIGPDTRLVDCAVGADAVVEKTMARDAEIGVGAHVGPFAVLESGTHVGAARRTGPFYHAGGPENDEGAPPWSS